MADLESELGALGLTARQFLDVVRPPKLFRGVWRGSDILEALDRHKQEREAERRRLERPERRGRPRKVEAEIEQLAMPKV
jgi:hypothetical protein